MLPPGPPRATQEPSLREMDHEGTAAPGSRTRRDPRPAGSPPRGSGYATALVRGVGAAGTDSDRRRTAGAVPGGPQGRFVTGGGELVTGRLAVPLVPPSPACGVSSFRFGNPDGAGRGL